MKLPIDDDDLRGDDRFDDDDHEALFAKSSTNRIGEQQRNPVVNCCLTGIVSIQFLWIFRRTEFILGLILLTSVTLAFTGVIETYEMKKHHKDLSHHQFSHEYADLKSVLELKLKDIDHWCLDGRDDTCPKCDDPTHPISRGEYDGWKHAFMRNVKLSKDFANRDDGVQPDVIFLGDSLVEATVGTLKGIPGLDGTAAARELDDVKAYYDKKFTKANGGKYDALRLGIAGDTSPNVFWRIRQNEMRDLKPKVWWVSVGRNDMFRTKCSEEVALMGVIRVVEELISKEDGATIVINSLLPTSKKPTLQLEGHFAHNEMWTSIKEVNTRLKKFAQKHHHVVFYDANEVFVETRYKKMYIKKHLYVDKVHPSFNGYKELAKSQLEFLDYLMQKRYASASQLKEKGSKSQSQTKPQDNTDSAGTEEATPGDEYLSFDDYYGYQSIFQGTGGDAKDNGYGTDDLLNDIFLYDDGLDDDW